MQSTNEDEISAGFTQMLTKSFGVDGVMDGFCFVLCSVLAFKKYLLRLIWYNAIVCISSLSEGTKAAYKSFNQV